MVRSMNGRHIACATRGAATLLALGIPNVAFATCGADSEVWTRSERGVEVRAYKGPGVHTIGPYFFEGRINGKLAWRVTGQYGCTNGISRCSVEIPMSSGDPVRVPETVIGTSEMPEYVVFADLEQSLGYIQVYSAEPTTVRADIFDVGALAEISGGTSRPAIVLPNYLKFAGCLKGNGDIQGVEESPEAEVAAAPIPSSRPGPFDGLWQRPDLQCEKTAEDSVPVSVRGSKLEFYESSCEIADAADTATSLNATMSCAGEGEQWGMSIELVKRLDLLMLAYENEQPNEYRRCPAS